MKNEVEQRLHRVMIKLDKKSILCPYANDCTRAENCNRCNVFYHKCFIFTNFISESK